MILANVEIQSYDLDHTKETLDSARISYNVEPFSNCWLFDIVGTPEAVEKWMKEEFLVGMDAETAAEFMADIVYIGE
ncbi:hypothetical protein PS2_111 [Serratia phage PS2]|uniref:Uncharacterized 8.8 kDa protein in frd-Gp32 intergenic region n=1 Tax=Serratia phage PS2 TaxID=1481112 RepID=A0A023W6I6_9CAUD|nr:hypothetical protein FF83_gp111 [Serratia phage PS2]AHY25357.1 hypothetical protein PS2_111 [Serratia phage PS2]